MPADPAFLQAARRLCSERGALLIFDEIQCGMGRLGTLFAFEHFGVRPDVLTMAKALANGLPIGAVLIDASLADALRPGDHGSTFGGSPIPCAAALAHLNIREQIGLDAHVRRMGKYLLQGLQTLARERADLFEEPRGIGLILGLPVREPHQAKAIVNAAVDQHLLLNAAGRNTLRFVPPLIISEAEIDLGLERLRVTLSS
jgi:acetylornithine/N-succinyldiaminopimelate aminotransferase